MSDITERIAKAFWAAIRPNVKTMPDWVLVGAAAVVEELRQQPEYDITERIADVITSGVRQVAKDRLEEYSFHEPHSDVLQLHWLNKVAPNIGRYIAAAVVKDLKLTKDSIHIRIEKTTLKQLADDVILGGSKLLENSSNSSNEKIL